LFAAALGAIALLVVLIRRDPVVLALICALIVFAAMAIALSLLCSLNSRPRLEYRGFTGAQFEFGDERFGTEQGGFFWGKSVLQPLLVRVANTQKAVDIAANNVTALIHYKHYDKRDKATMRCIWMRRDGGFVDSVQLESGETAFFVIMYTYPPTPNQEVPGAKRTKDFLAAGDLFDGALPKKLGVGHWQIRIEVTSDNSAPLLLKGGFTITRDEKIELDSPLLRKLGAWD
jgi:hypothetical protein